VRLQKTWLARPDSAACIFVSRGNRDDEIENGFTGFFTKTRLKTA
jgi:hypothetical protein